MTQCRRVEVSAKAGWPRRPPLLGESAATPTMRSSVVRICPPMSAPPARPCARTGGWTGNRRPRRSAHPPRRWLPTVAPGGHPGAFQRYRSLFERLLATYRLRPERSRAGLLRQEADGRHDRRPGSPARRRPALDDGMDGAVLRQRTRRGQAHRLGSSSGRNQSLGSGSGGPGRAGASSGLEVAARSGTSCWLTGSASTRTSCRCPLSVSVTTSVTR
jgi:hypothetical protein